MKCDKCGCEEFAYITRQGKAISKKFAKEEKQLKSAFIILSILLFTFATKHIALTIIEVIMIISTICVYLGYKIRKAKIPNEHIEMVCKNCSEIYYINEE